MAFFAANSVLARLALRAEEIDAGSFTAVRILSGALVLALLIGARGTRTFASIKQHGSWYASLALFAYATAFSYAYLSLDAGAGALILFALVQATMIGTGMVRGERPGWPEWSGLILAMGGLACLVSPGLDAQPVQGAILMSVSGIAWGAYSLAGREASSAMIATAGNFVRAVPMAIVVLLVVWSTGRAQTSLTGLGLAIASGGISSGLGYTIWYMALAGLSATRAAIVQLTVPLIAAGGGVVFIGEAMSWRLAIAAIAILGGVTLALLGKPNVPGKR